MTERRTVGESEGGNMMDRDDVLFLVEQYGHARRNGKQHDKGSATWYVEISAALDGLYGEREELRGQLAECIVVDSACESATNEEINALNSRIAELTAALREAVELLHPAFKEGFAAALKETE